jgi:hypothetical protein
VSWTTNKRSTGEVRYGETTSYGKIAPAKAGKTSEGKDDTTGQLHQAELEIEKGKTSHYKIDVTDDEGNAVPANDMSFTVAADGKITGTAAPIAPPVWRWYRCGDHWQGAAESDPHGASGTPA